MDSMKSKLPSQEYLSPALPEAFDMSPKASHFISFPSQVTFTT